MPAGPSSSSGSRALWCTPTGFRACLTCRICVCPLSLLISRGRFCLYLFISLSVSLLLPLPDRPIKRSEVRVRLDSSTVEREGPLSERRQTATKKGNKKRKRESWCQSCGPTASRQRLFSTDEQAPTTMGTSNKVGPNDNIIFFSLHRRRVFCRLPGKPLNQSDTFFLPGQ